MPPNGPVVGLGAVCVRVGMCFCIVPIDGDELAVMIKWSRCLSPDKRRELLPVQKLASGDAKTMTTARRTAALLTLSRQQDCSR
jgi:hypothetical protein